MRSKKNVETIKLNSNETLKQEFDNYKDMATSAVDWTLFCSYQLKPDFSEGAYKFLQLTSMQIVSTEMTGGIMFDYVVPEKCMTLSIIKRKSGKACIDQMKLETGMIVITDDTKKYNFLCSESVELFDISFNPNSDPLVLKKLKSAVDKYYVDKDQKFTTQIEKLIDQYAATTTTTTTIDRQHATQIEAEILQSILDIMESQEAETPHFTKSEKIAMEIKQKLFKHMDGKMSINTLAKEYTISEKSLQNAFRSLFDITPNQFMRLLKLNLVHHELTQSSAAQTSVLRVAQKWGFAHMGRFSKYYRDLFGENPSVTLKSDTPMPDGMKEHCVERQEEMA